MTDNIEDWLSGGPDLRRVIEINLRTRTRDGVPLLLVSLEVWEDSVRLVYVTTTVEQAPTPAADDPRKWILTDGRGTVFDFRSGGGGGIDGKRMYSNISWTPAPAHAASSLHITHDFLGVDVELDLRADPAS